MCSKALKRRRLVRANFESCSKLHETYLQQKINESLPLIFFPYKKKLFKEDEDRGQRSEFFFSLFFQFLDYWTDIGIRETEFNSLENALRSFFYFQTIQRKLGYILHECYVLNGTDNILKYVAWAAIGGMLFSNITFHRRLKEENVGNIDGIHRCCPLMGYIGENVVTSFVYQWRLWRI